MRKRGRIPEILWRIFGKCARTLVDTVISLVLPVPPDGVCICQGRRCLACAENALSFLIRPDDPPDYVNLLFHCFVVVSDNAPPTSRFDHDNRWPQKIIVPAVIESILKERSLPSNEICNGYDVWSRGSSIVELLTSPEWALLLKRVGDDLMSYLLKHGSIFLSVEHKRHRQVTGPPIVDRCSKLSSKKKTFRKYEMSLKNVEEFRPSRRLPSNDASVNSFDLLKSWTNGSTDTATFHVASNASKNCYDQSILKPNRGRKIYSWQRRRKHHQLCKPEIQAEMLGKGEGFKAEISSFTGDIAKTGRKRLRQFKWQRRRLRMKPNTHLEQEPHAVASLGNPSLLSGVSSIPSQSFNQASFHKQEHPLQNIKERTKVNRQSMFYNSASSPSVLPRSHLLYSLNPNYTGGSILLRDIFGLSERYFECKCDRDQRCKYHSLLKFLKIFIRKTHYCQHIPLLDKHCTVSFFDGNASRGVDNHSEESGSQSVSSQSYCSKSQVVSFIWAACRNMIPGELLGNVTNWRILRRNIARFICLRRFENFSLKQCLNRLKISDFPILLDQTFSFDARKHASMNVFDDVEHSLKSDGAFDKLNHECLKHWIYWLFSNFLVPLVKTNFFVTESQHGRKDVFYYRRSIWERLADEAVIKFTNQDHHLLDNASVWNIIKGRPFGFSRLRLCPKEDGVRALTNLSAPSIFSARNMDDHFIGLKRRSKLGAKQNYCCKFRSVNHVLKDTHVVLTGLRWQETESLGASVFDYNDVYKRLRPFLDDLRRRPAWPFDVFIVVADVMKAFDSVNHETLLAIMEDILRQDAYTLKQSWQLVCVNGSFSVQESKRLVNPTSFECTSVAPSPGVLFAKEKILNMKRQDLYSTLKEHVTHNILQFRNKFYMQKVGIPQGSGLSTLLCSFYYGHMENHLIIPFLEKTREHNTQNLSRENCVNASLSKLADELKPACNNVLLRFVDDFLFISTSKKQAESFLVRVKRGFKKYNCYMNEKKFSVNFNAINNIMYSAEKVCVGEDEILFIRWSGLLMNCRTLEIQADYTRYLNNHLRSTLTVRWLGKPIDHLKATLCAFMRPKCHAIFYDSNMNSAAIVRLNIYQAFLLSAMKFHCYISSLSEICSFQAASYMAMILKSLRYMEKLIRRRVSDMKCRYNMQPKLQLEKGEVTWLGLNAYISVLKKKQSSHKELLRLLTSRLSSHELHCGISPPLMYAIDRSHSSVLWRIEY